MAQKQISRFPLNVKFSGLSGHVSNYGENEEENSQVREREEENSQSKRREEEKDSK